MSDPQTQPDATSRIAPHQTQSNPPKSPKASLAEARSGAAPWERRSILGVAGRIPSVAVAHLRPCFCVALVRCKRGNFPRGDGAIGIILGAPLTARGMSAGSSRSTRPPGPRTCLPQNSTSENTHQKPRHPLLRGHFPGTGVRSRSNPEYVEGQLASYTRAASFVLPLCFTQD